MEIIIGLIASTIGLSYFVYGKKNIDLYFMLFGVVLMLYPYFVRNVILSAVLGIVFTVGPFIAKKIWD